MYECGATKREDGNLGFLPRRYRIWMEEVQGKTLRPAFGLNQNPLFCYKEREMRKDGDVEQ